MWTCAYINIYILHNIHLCFQFNAKFIKYKITCIKVITNISNLLWIIFLCLMKAFISTSYPVQGETNVKGERWCHLVPNICLHLYILHNTAKLKKQYYNDLKQTFVCNITDITCVSTAELFSQCSFYQIWALPSYNRWLNGYSRC